MARITTTHRITGRADEPVTAAELRDFITGLPDDAQISVSGARTGNQMDPGEWSLTASELPRPAKQQLNPPGTRGAPGQIPAAVLPTTMGPDVPPTPVWAQEGFTRGS